MKYQSEIIKEIIDTRGHEKSSLHYESECIETWIEENKGAYPKLTDYQSEWLNYINEKPIGEFPYETITDVTNATIDNVVPLAYKSAILKGNTKYRDIDTVDILDTFDETKNLELVSVKMPVLTVYDGNITNIPLSFFESGNYNYNGWTNFNINCSNVKITAKLNNFLGSDYSLRMLLNNKQIIDLTSFEEKVISLNTLTNIGFHSGSSILGGNIGNLLEYLTTGTLQLKIEVDGYPPYPNYDGSTKTNILTVNEEVELRGIGDVKDTLDCLTGEVVERIGEVVLDGSQTFTLTGTPNQVDTLCILFPNFPKIANGAVMSDKLIKASNYDYSDFECISQNAFGIAIRLLRNRLESADINGVKKFLSQNPITVQYQLETESVKTVDLNIQDQDGKTLSVIKPIEGTMHLSTSSDTIKPLFSGEIPVEAITQNIASFIDLEMEE